jgi:hypothetical protein
MEFDKGLMKKIMTETIDWSNEEKSEYFVMSFYNDLIDEIPNKKIRLQKAKDFALFTVDTLISHVEPSLDMRLMKERVKMWRDVKNLIINFKD